MGKRRNDRYYRPEDDIDGLAGCLGYLLFGVIAGTIVAIFQSKQVPPEDELQALDEQTFWDQPLAPIICATCQALNEPNQSFCFSCGERGESFVKKIPEPPKDIKSDWRPTTFSGLVVYTVVFLIIAWVILDLIGRVLEFLFF